MKQFGMASLFFILLVGNVLAQDKIEKWDVFEVTLKGPSTGNPFMGTELFALFTNGDKVYEQEGYYYFNILVSHYYFNILVSHVNIFHLSLNDNDQNNKIMKG